MRRGHVAVEPERGLGNTEKGGHCLASRQPRGCARAGRLPGDACARAAAAAARLLAASAPLIFRGARRPHTTVKAMSTKEAVPDPDAEVPKEIRDEFFKWMRAKQSERVRRAGRACRSPPVH